MRNSSLVFLAYLSLVGCRSPRHESTNADAAQAPAPGDAQAAATAEAPAEPPANEKLVLSTDALALFKKHLVAGREHAGAKRWTQAVSAFEAALEAVPGNARALSELGYSAYFAGDLDKARRINALALTAASEPGQKAQVLFNQGMVEEKQEHPELARARYQASLALRPNAVVQKRLDALGMAAACDGAFADLGALCTCRITREQDSVMLMSHAVPVCAEQPVPSVDGLKVLRWGVGDSLGENQWFLAARGKDGWRKLVDVGSDFEPGAFGVHNEAKVDSITSRTVQGRRVALVEWTQHNTDMNMAGLEVNTYEAHHLTVCVLDDQPRCPVSLPLVENTSLEYSRDLVDADDTETQRTLAELERDNPPFSRSATARYVIDDQGKLTVTETRGKRPHLAPWLRGVALW